MWVSTCREASNIWEVTWMNVVVFNLSNLKLARQEKVHLPYITDDALVLSCTVGWSSMQKVKKTSCYGPNSFPDDYAVDFFLFAESCNYNNFILICISLPKIFEKNKTYDIALWSHRYIMEKGLKNERYWVVNGTQHQQSFQKNFYKICCSIFRRKYLFLL